MRLPFYNQRLENAIQVMNTHGEDRISKKLSEKIETSSLDVGTR